MDTNLKEEFFLNMVEFKYFIKYSYVFFFWFILIDLIIYSLIDKVHVPITKYIVERLESFALPFELILIVLVSGIATFISITFKALIDDKLRGDFDKFINKESVQVKKFISMREQIKKLTNEKSDYDIYLRIKGDKTFKREHDETRVIGTVFYSIIVSIVLQAINLWISFSDNLPMVICIIILGLLFSFILHILAFRLTAQRYFQRNYKIYKEFLQDQEVKE